MKYWSHHHSCGSVRLLGVVHLFRTRWIDRRLDEWIARHTQVMLSRQDGSWQDMEKDGQTRRVGLGRPQRQAHEVAPAAGDGAREERGDRSDRLARSGAPPLILMTTAVVRRRGRTKELRLPLREQSANQICKVSTSKRRRRKSSSRPPATRGG